VSGRPEIFKQDEQDDACLGAPALSPWFGPDLAAVRTPVAGQALAEILRKVRTLHRFFDAAPDVFASSTAQGLECWSVENRPTMIFAKKNRKLRNTRKFEKRVVVGKGNA